MSYSCMGGVDGRVPENPSRKRALSASDALAVDHEVAADHADGKLTLHSVCYIYLPWPAWLQLVVLCEFLEKICEVSQTWDGVSTGWQLLPSFYIVKVYILSFLGVFLLVYISSGVCVTQLPSAGGSDGRLVICQNGLKFGPILLLVWPLCNLVRFNTPLAWSQDTKKGELHWSVASPNRLCEKSYQRSAGGKTARFSVPFQIFNKSEKCKKKVNLGHICCTNCNLRRSHTLIGNGAVQ